jgi:hypothetical protein
MVGITHETSVLCTALLQTPDQKSELPKFLCNSKSETTHFHLIASDEVWYAEIKGHNCTFLFICIDWGLKSPVFGLIFESSV